MYVRVRVVKEETAALETVLTIIIMMQIVCRNQECEKEMCLDCHKGMQNRLGQLLLWTIAPLLL